MSEDSPDRLASDDMGLLIEGATSRKGATHRRKGGRASSGVQSEAMARLSVLYDALVNEEPRPEDIVARSIAAVKPVQSVGPSPLPVHSSVQFIAQQHQPGSRMACNGSGLTALMRWERFLTATQDVSVSDPSSGQPAYVRGLINR